MSSHRLVVGSCVLAALCGLGAAARADESDLAGTWKVDGERFQEVWTFSHASRTWQVTGVYRKDGKEVGACHGANAEYADGALTFQRVFDKKPAPDLGDNAPCMFRVKDGQGELVVG